MWPRGVVTSVRHTTILPNMSPFRRQSIRYNRTVAIGQIEGHFQSNRKANQRGPAYSRRGASLTLPTENGKLMHEIQ